MFLKSQNYRLALERVKNQKPEIRRGKKIDGRLKKLYWIILLKLKHRQK
jgi:hypothetical protein